MNKSLGNAKGIVIRVPKMACLLLCFLMVYLLWSYLSSVSRTEKYRSDCGPLFSNHSTSACYETNAFATYEESRKATGGVFWYFVRFKLSDGKEIITKPNSGNPPHYLNPASIDGACRVRIWRDKIVEVKNNRIDFSTQDNPEIDLSFLRWMLLLSVLIAAVCIILLVNEIKDLRRRHNTIEL